MSTDNQLSKDEIEIAKPLTEIEMTVMRVVLARKR